MNKLKIKHNNLAQRKLEGSSLSTALLGIYFADARNLE